MKKTLLLSAVASTLLLAGGDIAPAPEAVEVETVSPWTFGGDAKLYYSTDDFSDGDLFDQANSYGQAAISADVAYALTNTVKVNVGVTGLATLGLDDSVVSGVWLYAGANALDGVLPFTSIGDALWIDTANITGTAMDGKVTYILGRTELDTPLAFSETWTIANNTFDAAVGMVSPMEGLTLVGAYIYDGNGNGDRVGTLGGGFTGGDGYLPFAGVEEGAWAVAGIYATGGLTAQAWYYDVIDLAQAVWAQADYTMGAFSAGAQYGYMDPSDAGDALGADLSKNESTAYAFKLGYKMDALEAWAAYSAADEDGILPMTNTATMAPALGSVDYMGWGNQSKLYTEAWWNYGFVGAPGADSIAVAASYAFAENMSLFGQYTTVSDAFNTTDMDEFAAVLSTSMGALSVDLAYIWAEYTEGDMSEDGNTLQAYITYTF
jgi:imipenem/basic amino acid-specific outer membrane pore